MSKKQVLLFILYTFLLVVITIFGTVTFIKSMSFIPLPSGEAKITSGISYVVPTNWRVTKQPGNYPQEAWSAEESISIDSPDTSKNSLNCGINCANTSPDGIFTISSYDSHQLTDAKKWYTARLQSHQTADGPETTYTMQILGNQPAYCATYKAGFLADESCYVWWHNTIYGISFIAKSYADFAAEKLIWTSITFH